MQEVLIKQVSNELIWEIKNSRAVCVLLHDFNTGPVRFRKLGEHLAQQGIQVVAPDLFALDQNNALENSLQLIDEVIEKNTHKYKKLPFFLCGEGYGAMLAMHYAQHREEKVSGVVAISPFFKFSFPMVNRFDLMMSYFFRSDRFYNLPIKSSMVTKDDSYISQLDNEKDRDMDYTAKFFIEFQNMTKEVLNNRNRLTVPSFFLLAQEDLLSENYVTHDFYQNLHVDDKKIDYYPEFHALSIPQDSNGVYGDISKWICNRTVQL